MVEGNPSNTCTLVYFGFTHILYAKESVPYGELRGSYTLPSTHPLWQAIKRDIDWLERAAFKKGRQKAEWSVEGIFTRIDGTSVYVFNHSDYVSCSSAVYENFKSQFSVDLLPPIIDGCSCQNDHEPLYPFFMDNASLRVKWSRHPALLRELDEHPPSVMFLPNSDNVCGLEYSENIWTQRLVGVLKKHLASFNVMYTAEMALSFSSFQGLNIDFDFPEKAYIFHGFPDIVVQTKEASLVIEIDGDGVATQDAEVIEVGRNADPLQKYPPKLGQLMSEIHISLVQLAGKIFIHNTQIPKRVVGKGLYINRNSLPFLAVLGIPVAEATQELLEVPTPVGCISLSTPRGAYLTPPVLCEGIQKLVGFDRCLLSQ